MSRVVGQNSLAPQENNNLNSRLARDEVALLETAKKFVSKRASSKRFLRIFFFSIFELRDMTKHLMTRPAGNSEFCFPSTSMFPSVSLACDLYSTCPRFL